MTEIWKEIPEFEGYAEVSTGGVIRTVGRTYVNKNGISRFFKGRVVPSRLVRGYPVVSIPSSGGQRRILNHRAVLLTFVGPCPDGMQACHKDGNRTNSSLDNLRWDTARENEADKIKHGTLLRGERVSAAKLNEAQVRDVLRNQDSASELVKRLGVSVGTISDIRRGKTWQHVSKGMSDFEAEVRAARKPKNSPVTARTVPDLSTSI